MGRAITMENKLEGLERRVKTAEDALAKVIDIVEALEQKSCKVKPVNLTSKKKKLKKEKKNVSKEKTNNEGNGKSNK